MKRQGQASVTVAMMFSFICASALVFAQGPASKPPQETALDYLVGQFKAQTPGGRAALISTPGFFAPYLAVMPEFTESGMDSELFHDFEEQRVDKEVTAAGSSQGSTAVANKGSVPWLFGFAVEHGALTQSVENNQIVLRGNVANTISALKFHDYMLSYAKLQEQNQLVRNISKTSFSISFNASQSSGSSAAASAAQPTSFGGFSVHYDIYNHRDPRDPKWDKVWSNVRTEMGAVPTATAAFRRVVPGFDTSSEEAQNELASLGVNPTDDQIRVFLKRIGDNLAAQYRSSPEVKMAAQDVAKALISSSKAKAQAVTKLMQSPTVSFEYSYVRQTTNQVPTTSQGGTVSTSLPLPNLSNFNLIANTYLIAGSQLSVNASTTIFDSLASGSKSGRVRDYRLAAQVDIPLPEITNVGKPTLTFSGLFMGLLQQPLGQQILVNGVAESRTGNIGLLQSKVSIPIKGSGVKVPISFTYANRSELIKEHDIRGEVGVTFDLDSLFSKPQ
jgi:hypothetical protein